MMAMIYGAPLKIQDPLKESYYKSKTIIDHFKEQGFMTGVSKNICERFYVFNTPNIIRNIT